MPISSRYLIQFTSTSLFVGLVALMAIVVMNFWLGERAQSYFDGAIASRDTRVAAVELRNALQTAESSQRGFVITGNEIYLGPYQTAKAISQRQMTALQTVLPGYPNADVALKRLSDILDAKFDEMDRTIFLKRGQKNQEVLALLRTNKGKALTDEANVFFAGIIGQADERLTAGVAEQNSNTRWLRLVSAIGAIVIVAMVGGVAIGVARYTKELRETRDQLNTLNTELEQRVAHRTKDLAQSRDRAEVLLSEVNHRVANSLALLSSLVNLQSRALHDPASKEALAETQDRIFAISLVHKKLYTSNNARSVVLGDYLNGLLDHLRTSMRSQGGGVTLKCDIEPVELETDASINLGVVVTELVTNAYKYAYPEEFGEIRVRLQTLPDKQVELVVEDDGVGRSGGPPQGTGVGTKIVNAMSMSLGAKLDYRDLAPGTAAHLVFSPKPTRAVATS